VLGNVRDRPVVGVLVGHVTALRAPAGNFVYPEPTWLRVSAATYLRDPSRPPTI
jgi:hypothetical protein